MLIRAYIQKKMIIIITSFIIKLHNLQLAFSYN